MSAFLYRLGELTFFSLAARYATGQSIPLNLSPQNSGKSAIRFRRLPLAFESNGHLSSLVVIAALLLISVQGLSGCSSSGSESTPAAKTYTVAVTATDMTTNIKSSTNLTLIVQ